MMHGVRWPPHAHLHGKPPGLVSLIIGPGRVAGHESFQNNGSGSWGAAQAIHSQGAAFNPMQPMNQFTDPTTRFEGDQRVVWAPGEERESWWMDAGTSWTLAVRGGVPEGKDDREWER
jgi:hypothetical protein